MGHIWNSDWPARCTRCNAIKVMERAIYEEWVQPAKPEEGGPDVWKSSGYRDLVFLCDDHCYADMGYDAVNKHKANVIAQCAKVGWIPKQGKKHE